ncbi:MAG: site-specific recombinase [Pseudomonadota bacterium]
MLVILERIAAHPATSDIDNLVQLVRTLRPANPENIERAIANTEALKQTLLDRPDLAAALRAYLMCVLAERRHTSLYTDTGILSSDGFFSELFRRLSYRLLPPAVNDVYLRDCLDRILCVDTDHVWISGVPAASWLALFDGLADAGVLSPPDPAVGQPAVTDATHGQNTLTELLEAIQTLSYRISAMGLEPALIRIHPDIETFASPFLMQNVEVHLYLEDYVRHLNGGPVPVEDAKHLLVMLDQCDTVISKIRKNALRQGTSVALTYLLVRLSQNIDRLRKLLSVVDISHQSAPADDAGSEKNARRSAALALALELVEAHNSKYAVRELIAHNVNLLARNVTENASRTGEHYIAENRSQFAAMFRSSAGAGVIVGFMGLFKILTSALRAAPLVETFLFSLNYSLGFMLIHVLHFTVATKQPAMTASRIATDIHSRDGRNIDIDSLVEMIVKVFRTQFVAVLGNLATAIPTAFLIAWGYFYLRGQHLVSPEKAHRLLHEIDPFTSLALFHAAIAGVCLFLAGLVSGYYDNKALYTQMSQRVVQLNWLRRLLGAARLERFAHYLENNLGGLMGNFTLGILLASAGTIGYMTGLPLDVRHVTLSSTYLAIALAGLDNVVSTQLLAISALGIVLVGMVNLLVSFGLALFVALRSRQVRFRQGWTLFKALLMRLLRKPVDFFLPPKDAPEPIDGSEDTGKPPVSL